MFCVFCGAKIPDGARFCPKCGQPIPVQVAPEPTPAPVPPQPVAPEPTPTPVPPQSVIPGPTPAPVPPQPVMPEPAPAVYRAPVPTPAQYAPRPKKRGVPFILTALAYPVLYSLLSLISTLITAYQISQVGIEYPVAGVLASTLLPVLIASLVFAGILALLTATKVLDPSKVGYGDFALWAVFSVLPERVFTFALNIFAGRALGQTYYIGVTQGESMFSSLKFPYVWAFVILLIFFLLRCGKIRVTRTFTVASASIAAGVLVIISAVLTAFAPPLARLYVPSPDVVVFCIPYLRISLLCLCLVRFVTLWFAWLWGRRKLNLGLGFAFAAIVLILPVVLLPVIMIGMHFYVGGTALCVPIAYLLGAVLLLIVAIVKRPRSTPVR